MAPGRKRIAVAATLLVAMACRSALDVDGIGDVVAIDATQRQLTLRHDGLPGVRGATTLQVRADESVDLGAIAPGDRIRFRLRRREDVLSLLAVTPAPRARVGFHDHTPHHGGLVAMIGATHLEAVARDRGRVNLYLTDLWRRPMPMDGVTGTITFYDDAGSHPVAVEIEGDHLVVQGPAPRKSSVRIRVELLHQVGPIGMTYELPIQPEAAGAVGVLRAGCEAASVADRDLPRCQLRMTAPITAMDSSDAGDLLAVAAVGVGVTVWELPAMRLRTSLAAAPTSSVTSEEMPHAESVNAVAFGPDGREIAIALEGRILVHSTGDGRLLRELPRNSGMIRTMTWSPVQSELLVLGFYEHGASIVDARDGVVHAVLATPDEAAAVGWSPDGQRIAVATDAGRLGICDRNAPRKCNWGHTGGRVHRVEWLDGLHVVVAQATGATSIWSNDAIQQTQLSPVAALPAVVVSPRSDALAAGGQDGTIHLSTPTAAERGVSLRAHDAPITALSWVGTSLVSGDAAGLVSVWNTSDDRGHAVMREMSID